MVGKTKRLIAMLLATVLTFGTLSPMTVYANETTENPTDEFAETQEFLLVQENPDSEEDCSVQGHSWVEADCDTAKTCSVCGATEGEALGHNWVDADCDTAKTCSVCGATEGEALGHSWEEDKNVKVCSACGAEEKVQQTEAPEEPAEGDVLTVSDEEMLSAELVVKDYATFLAELKILEQYADEYAPASGKSAGELIVNFIRTGVERYNDGNWKTLAGEEITGFTTYVQEQDAANSTTAMRLKNIVIEEFLLPNDDQVDFGHMFGTMNIAYVASQASADLAGWAGDLCDLLLYSKEYGNVPAGTVDEMATYILANCFGVDADDAFGMDDFYGDMDAYYLINEWKGTGSKLSDIMEAYFVAELDDGDRSAYFMNNRFSGLETQEDVRTAVYNAYAGNIGLQVLESDRGLSDANELRQAACYAFADYLFAKGGDQLEGDSGETTDPSEPSEPVDPEDPDVDDPADPEIPANSYYEDFSVTESFLAPGISQSIHYALSADKQQMVYYVATVDVNRDDVTIMANYRNADPSQGWGMARVEDQAAALNAKHSNPEDAENYIENFNVVVATNGDGYNMSTGKPGGLLIMGGVEYNPVDKDGFFAILKDGSAMIGTREDYDIYKDQLQEAIGGFGATLVKDGEIVVSKSANHTKERASRTAVGITESGAVVMMVLDGRQEPFSCGGSMEEIAQIMLEAGCVEAINLDGGGSTTYLSKPEGADKLTLVNRPSDGYARSVAASLAAVSTAKISNEFDHANISFDYDYLTIGSSVTATAVGVSGSGNAAPIPEDATWQVSDETIGTITQEGVFTAADNGDVEIRLVQGENVLGSKTLHVVIPDGVGFARESMNLIFGVPTELPVVITYNGNPVAFNDGDFIIALTDENAGSFEGAVFTADPEASIRNVTAVAFLMLSEDAYGLMELNIYKDGEAVFNFDDVTAGNRQLAWKRGVSNSTTQDKVVYSIADPSKPMDITYVFGMDMKSIEIPAQLADLTVMLPGADTGSTAWDFLLQLAERVSVLTEVRIHATFDADLEIDVSNLTVMNEYFVLDKINLDPETNELTVTCKWVDQTKAIDPATANPICILSGIKATPKADAGWTDVDQLEIVNSGKVSYEIYLRASALYSFAQKPENQLKYGLLPYSSSDTGYEGGTESGAYFGTTYAEFEDAFTLDKALKQGWYNFDDQLFYYVDHVPLTGIQKVPSTEDPTVELFYEFGENGACTGKVTGLFEYNGGLMYAILGQQRVGWQAIYDRNGKLCDYYFSPYTGKAVDGECRVEGYDYIFTDHVLTRGDLVTDAKGTRYRWAGLWVTGKWFELDGNLYHTAKYQQYVTTGYSHIVGQDLEYHWHLFDENGVFQKDYTGKYHIGQDTYYLENGIMIQEPGLVLLDDGYYYYFCSTGKAVKNRTYWPTKTNGLLPMGPYVFDEEGRIVNPPVTEPDQPGTPDTPDTPDVPVEKKNGIYSLNGKLYYYKEDVIQYCAGLVALENEDGTVDYIYVRSNGQLAVGNYWTTSTNGLLPQGIYHFGEDGIMTNPPSTEPDQPGTPDQPDIPDQPVVPEEPKPVKQGIYEEGGVLYYYKDGTRAYCAGLLQLEDGSYIYVRSNGSLATGSYWITNDNGLLPQQAYLFGEDGKMVNPPETEPEDPDQPETPVEPEVKNGVYELNGKLYYYENDAIAYCKGIVKLTDETGADYYIYVRSNGQLAIGNYWPTTTNDLLPGNRMYTFDANGRYYPA